MSKQTLVEKDIKATIRLLRFLTHGEGYASVSIFDAGAGGGFSSGSLSVNLERSGLILKSNEVYEAKDLFELIKQSLYPYDEKSIKAINEMYKNSVWDR